MMLPIYTPMLSASRKMPGRLVLLMCILHCSFCFGRVKRERAFDLLRIESEFEASEEGGGARMPSGHHPSAGHFRRDEAIDDERCQQKCNDRIRSGLDMVKAHTSFGSVGVPSVIDELDLQIFCRLDAEHDKCLRDCGYEVQFNMRDYVCKDRYWEMVNSLPCYVKAAPQLKRRCGAKKCGPYTLEVSPLRYAQRCRQLLCDLDCNRHILLEQCGQVEGARASQFLVDYSRLQVSAWMKDNGKGPITPASCQRLLCDNGECIFA